MLDQEIWGVAPNPNCFLVHFLLAQKMNQKRAPKMPTSAFLSARYTCLNGATKKAAVDFVELAVVSLV
jgi:hypothetical protein